MKRLFSLLSLLGLTFLSLSAQDLGASLLRKAEEAFNAGRWKSAGTLYDLYLKDSASYSPAWAYALLADELDGDSISEQRATAIYLDNLVRLDTLLADLRTLCVERRFFDAYEESVSRLRTVLPERRGELLNNLIEYRFFLRDADNALRLAQLGRLEEPDNVDWLRAEAQAWMLLGDEKRVLALYRSIRAYVPNDLDALIFEGNYHYLRGKEAFVQLNADFFDPKTRSSAAYAERLHQLILSELNPAADLLNRAFAQSDNKYLARTLSDIYMMRGDHNLADKIRKQANR